MNTWIWSYLIWGLRWLLIDFLVFEMLSRDVLGIAPWYSLTGTTRHAISTYPPVGPLLFALLIALGVHFIYRRPLWHSVVFGIGIALVAHWLDKRL